MDKYDPTKKSKDILNLKNLKASDIDSAKYSNI
jgi:hypothetical protein